MTTGQCAWRRQARVTGPMASGGCPGRWRPGRVVPRTSISAPAVRSTSARAGGSSVSSAFTRPGGRRRRAASAVAVTIALAAAFSPAGSGASDGGAYGARSLPSWWQAEMMCTAAWRSRASRTAQRTAAEAAVPSTPTTIRLRARMPVMTSLPANGLAGKLLLMSPQRTQVIRAVGPAGMGAWSCQFGDVRTALDQVVEWLWPQCACFAATACAGRRDETWPWFAPCPYMGPAAWEGAIAAGVATLLYGVVVTSLT